MGQHNTQTRNEDISHSRSVYTNSPYIVLGHELYDSMILRFPVHTLQVEPIQDSTIVITKFIRSIPIYEYGGDNGTVHLSSGINNDDDRSLIESLDGFHGFITKFIKT